MSEQPPKTSMNPKKIAIIAAGIIIVVLVVLAIASWLNGTPEVAAGAGTAAVVTALGAARARAQDASAVAEAKTADSRSAMNARTEADAIAREADSTRDEIDSHHERIEKTNTLARDSDLSDLVNDWTNREDDPGDAA